MYFSFPTFVTKMNGHVIRISFPQSVLESLARRMYLMSMDADIPDNNNGSSLIPTHRYTFFFKFSSVLLLTSTSFPCFRNRNKNAHVIFPGFSLYSLSSISKIKSLVLFIYLSSPVLTCIAFPSFYFQNKSSDF